MKIATFNINSINARIENFCNWLRSEAPDIVLLQEIKSEFNAFPFFEIQTSGYNVALLGQKSYNGVAILSSGKITITQENLRFFEDTQARYLEADVEIAGQKYRVASVYAPNGNPPYNNFADTSRFEYKQQWSEAFLQNMQQLVSLPYPVIIGGDFNVIMSANDVYDTKPFANNALFHPLSRQKLKQMDFIGFFDTFRCLHPQENGYTFWDYAGNALNADFGMRIDYIFANAPAVDKLVACRVDKKPRQGEKPSDHTPLIAEFA